MSWLVFAFAGPILWAISTHLDKYLVEKYFKDSNVAVMLVFTALTGLLTLPFIAWHDPSALTLAPASAALIAFSGLLYMGAMLFYLSALQSEEASVIAPFYQASPLFGYVLAYTVLGETLTAVQMIGGALIVGGTLMVSWRSGAQHGFKARIAALMLTCALALAVSSLIFKAFALREEFWSTTFWMFAGQALFGASLLAIGPFRRQFLALLRSNLGALLTVNAINELVNLGGSLGMRFALTLAPLSLVQAVGSTTSLFVFGIGVALSLFWPSFSRESLSGRDLIRKGAAALLVAAGVALITR
jgi:drug/metabolite transporter (DMT)-like permease